MRSFYNLLSPSLVPSNFHYLEFIYLCTNCKRVHTLEFIPISIAIEYVSTVMVKMLDIQEIPIAWIEYPVFGEKIL